jgi:alpha-beta hydrolase superfamily lysophospholipase
LGAAGWRAYTMDLRGHGESAWSPEGDYRMMRSLMMWLR